MLNLVMPQEETICSVLMQLLFALVLSGIIRIEHCLKNRIAGFDPYPRFCWPVHCDDDQGDPCDWTRMSSPASVFSVSVEHCDLL